MCSGYTYLTSYGMIYTSIPYSLNKDLAAAYNADVERIPNDDDWCVFLDHDAMLLQPEWMKLLVLYKDKYPECRMFTCVTNRAGGSSPQRVVPKEFQYNNDISWHRYKASDIWVQNRLNVNNFSIPKPHHFSGVLMFFKKSLWKEIGGFRHWNHHSKILGVDSAWHEDIFKAKEKLYIMEGFYVYHWYRGGREKEISHLQ